MNQTDPSLGPKARRMPAAPRLILNGMEILPQVDDQWQPITGRWVLPGCRVVTYGTVFGIAQDNNWPLYLRQAI